MELSIALTGFKGWTGITKMLNTKIFHFLSEEITFRGKHDTNTSDLGSNSVADNLNLKNFYCDWNVLEWSLKDFHK